MTVKIQRKIKWFNDCGCKVDEDVLTRAALWLSNHPRLAGGGNSVTTETKLHVSQLDEWSFAQLKPDSIRRVLDGELSVDRYTLLIELDKRILAHPDIYTGEFIGECRSINHEKRWLNLFRYDMERNGFHFEAWGPRAYMMFGVLGLVGRIYVL